MANAFSMSTGPAEAMATIWFASTVKGSCLTSSGSYRSTMAILVTTRLSATSSGVEAIMAPSERRPILCPARPMRCTKRET
ncbi:MAG: hypothetical protein A4E30_00659 [Methanomassiliicoccales archaeon PtaB.Bin215]|nr:MAG: hypothetical protein A4E30_00659 [Methanomassiliicoccales archaeon PtaB.Bin215]